MCFHTAQTKSVQQIEKAYQVTLSKNAQRDLFDTPRYHINGFAHEQLLIIPQEKPSVLAAATWGIAPENKTIDELKSYYKESVRFGAGLNARSEKLFSHFLYKDLIFSKRCVIPITAFFEPHEFKKKKSPFVICPKTDEFLSLAGIYSRIGKVVTFAILTKEASPLHAKIHNVKKRQPVILPKDKVATWLSSNLTEVDINSLLGLKYDENKLDYYTVSKNLFHPKIDSNLPSIMEKVTYEELDF